METIINELRSKLENCYKTNFEITGKELMEKMNISFDDIYKETEKAHMEMYDCISIESPVKYLIKLNEILEFGDEVFWYSDELSKDYKYVTIGLDDYHNDCTSVIAMNVFMKGSFYHYNCAIIKEINKIAKEIEEIPVKLTI